MHFQKELMIDPHPALYRVSFFNDDFPLVAEELSKDVPALQVPVFALIADWRCASYAAPMPSLMTDGIANYHNGFVNAPGVMSEPSKFLDAVINRLTGDLPELVHTGKLRRQLRRRLENISAMLISTGEHKLPPIDADVVWGWHVDLHPFRMGIHSLMRLVYLAVYNAYESYLTTLGSIAIGGAEFRVGSREFNKDLRKAFDTLADDVWHDPQIRAAREVRNSLVHAGGGMTEALKSIPSIPVCVHNDGLHVYPEHIRALYQVLREPALNLLKLDTFRSSTKSGNAGT